MPDFRWGYKVAWFAIRSAEQEKIAKALKAANPKQVDWEKGVSEAYKHKGQAFISSPVKGWTFVVSSNLIEAAERGVAGVLNELGAKFGEAQYFMNYRIVGAVGWARSAKGKMTRGFVMADGEVYWDEGKITPAEVKIRRAYAKSMKESGEDFDEKDGYYVYGEDDVLAVAESWSFNPEKLDETVVSDPTGLLVKKLGHAGLRK